MATPPADGKGGQGQFNLGWYSNPKLDELTQKIASEIDQNKRNQMIAEAYKIHQTTSATFRCTSRRWRGE
jgi:peptide/nickel transport system substrate-binding protein